jgi:Copper type II ascorbate-dependent monooxygenase, N-terminal domain/Copper type II ascorbate-dependent monooxygenase, C-terminal domain
VGARRDVGATRDAEVPRDAEVQLDATIHAVTYTRDVRPILTRTCVPCHAADEIAPFALDTYASTQPMVAEIARLVHAHAMPPAPIDNSGACNTFRNTPQLSAAEVSTLDAWIADGAPQGDPSIAAPAPPVMPTLHGQVGTISTASDYAPSTAQPDSYHCFVAEAPIATGTYFVTGFDARPGNRRIVHHLIVHYPRSDAEADMARALDAAEPGPGYSCFADARVGSIPVAAWAPGYGATRFPDGLGLRLAGGRALVIEIHYNTVDGGGTDRTQVDLEVRTSGVTAGRFVALANHDLNLPPHMRDVAATATMHVADFIESSSPVHLYGVFPHMHTMATAQHVEVVHADSTRSCVADVPRWNFHWQRLYLYDTPLVLDPRDDIAITCRYDTSSRTAPVMWGEGTLDEMCVTAMFIGP